MEKAVRMTNREDKPERLMSVTEVAEWLQVSKAWVVAHANGQRRPALMRVKVGKCVRFRREDVDRFIKECEGFAA
jgi:excisionase family DNA binding protein